jgi:hypothetical protein
MAHEFLLHFHQSSRFIQERPEGMPERVPANSPETATNACGKEVTPFYAAGIPGCFASLERACKRAKQESGHYQVAGLYFSDPIRLPVPL